MSATEQNIALPTRDDIETWRMDADPSADFTYNSSAHTVTIAANSTGSAVVSGFASGNNSNTPDCTINIVPESSFSVTKTSDWTYEQTDYPNAGDGQIKATFLFDVSNLPQDAHLNENDFWSYITISSSSHIHYDAARGINPYEVDLWHDMGQSTASIQDTITFKYTDASNEQHIAVPVNNANNVDWSYDGPSSAFTFNKTFGWQESTVVGTRKISAYFQLDVSLLPDDANLQAADWYSHITVESGNSHTYVVSEWPQNDWMIMLEHTISSVLSSYSDVITLKWTDAENVEYIAMPLNNSDIVQWGDQPSPVDPTPADPTPAEPANP